MERKWRVRDDNFASLNIDVEAVIRKEALIKLGATFGEIITPSTLTYHGAVWVAQWARWSDSAADSEPKGLRQSYDTVVTQMRQAGDAKSPLTGDVAEDSGLTYPKDKVVHIRKGLRLRRRV